MSADQHFLNRLIPTRPASFLTGSHALRKKFAYLLVTVSVILLPATALAKPKKKTFNNTPEEVFLASLRTARERHIVTYVDEKNMLLTFETGTSYVSYGFNANASVEPEGNDKATLIINVQKKNVGKNVSVAWGGGDRMADKFFEQVAEELARESKQKVASKPEAAHVDVPPSPVVSHDLRPMASPQDTSQTRISEVDESAGQQGIDQTGPHHSRVDLDGSKAATPRTSQVPIAQQAVPTVSASTLQELQRTEASSIGAWSNQKPRIRRDGVVISGVTQGGPADDAGIQPGDYILAVDGHYVFTVEDLAQEIRRLSAGSKVSVRYRRYSTIYDTYLVTERVQANMPQ